MSFTKLFVLVGAAWAGFMVYRTQLIVEPFLPQDEEEFAEQEEVQLDEDGNPVEKSSMDAFMSYFSSLGQDEERPGLTRLTRPERQTGGIGRVGSGGGIRKLGETNSGGIGGVGANSPTSDFKTTSSRKKRPSKQPVELMQAAAKGDLDKLHALLEKQVPVDVRDNERRTALIYASWNGQNEAASLLLAAGANIQMQDRYDNNAMDYAAGRGLLETVDFLLKRTRTADTGRATEYARLILAAMTNNPDAIPQGSLSTINRISPEDQTPLMIAAGNGLLEIAEILIKRGADVNLPNRQGQTALHWAAWNDRYDMMAMLVAKGAKVDAQDHARNTPLIMAAAHNCVACVKFLLDKGADKYSANAQGQTAYFQAQPNNNKEILSLLK